MEEGEGERGEADKRRNDVQLSHIARDLTPCTVRFVPFDLTPMLQGFWPCLHDDEILQSLWHNKSKNSRRHHAPSRFAPVDAVGSTAKFHLIVSELTKAWQIFGKKMICVMSTATPARRRGVVVVE